MLPVDKFFYNVLYDKKNGYYNTSQPLGERGDYITSPITEFIFRNDCNLDYFRIKI